MKKMNFPIVHRLVLLQLVYERLVATLWRRFLIWSLLTGTVCAALASGTPSVIISVSLLYIFVFIVYFKSKETKESSEAMLKGYGLYVLVVDCLFLTSLVFEGYNNNTPIRFDHSQFTITAFTATPIFFILFAYWAWCQKYNGYKT